MASTKNAYVLPFRRKDLIKARADPRAHFGHLKHAIDFILPEGSTLLAAKEGEVVDIKVDSNKGGPDIRYAGNKYLNYMTIQHSNGELSQYAHLKYKGALVKMGAKVKTGQPIAISGNTGLSTNPHLHFHILKLNKTPIGWETLKIKFKERLKIDRKAYPIPKEMKKFAKDLEKMKKKLIT